jgi:Ni/Fe-hydrogenase subunit HybB-like protein
VIASPFDTFRGLPVHVLALHLTVVAVPVMALVTAAVPWRRSWRRRAAWPVVVLDALVLGLVWVTRQSGEQLQRRLPPSPQINHHVDLGLTMVWFSLAVLVVALLVALTRKASGGLTTLVGVLSVAAAVASVVWVVRVGESGSAAVWADLVANSTQR